GQVRRCNRERPSNTPGTTTPIRGHAFATAWHTGLHFLHDMERRRRFVPELDLRNQNWGVLAMTWFTSFLVEPFYRLFYGPLPTPASESTPARGLVLVADGVGGLDLCGIGLRYMLGMERLPYAVELFPWGHGLGRWLADLTDVANQDRQAEL